MGKIKKIRDKLVLGASGLFFGLKSGNELLQQKEKESDDGSTINQEKEVNSVLNDLLKGEETQRVKELRDEYYRTLKESENIKIERIRRINEGDTVLKIKRKTAADYAIKIDLYNPEDLPIRIIQDNKLYELSLEEVVSKGKEYISIFNIERDFIPRFKLEDYLKKIVVRTLDKDNVLIDMYTSEYASQFGKVDALFIKQLYDIKKENNKKSDITTFNKLSFITDNSCGEHSSCNFEYDNIVFQEINTFDGNFVLTFKATIRKDGEFIGDKFKTKEIDKKLEEHAKRDDVVVDADTLMRHIKQEENNEVPDYGPVIFSLRKNKDEENSN